MIHVLFLEPDVYNKVAIHMVKAKYSKEAALTIQINDGPTFCTVVKDFDGYDIHWENLLVKADGNEHLPLMEIYNNANVRLLTILVTNHYQTGSSAPVVSQPSSVPAQLCQWHVDYARQTQMLDQLHSDAVECGQSSLLRSRLASLLHLDPASANPLAHFSETK